MNEEIILSTRENGQLTDVLHGVLHGNNLPLDCVLNTNLQSFQVTLKSGTTHTVNISVGYGSVGGRGVLSNKAITMDLLNLADGVYKALLTVDMTTTNKKSIISIAPNNQALRTGLLWGGAGIRDMLLATITKSATTLSITDNRTVYSLAINNAELEAKWKLADATLTNAYKLADKVITDKAQMTKITADNGTVSVVATSGTMLDFLKNLAVGMHTVYITSAVTDYPATGTSNLRGTIHKVSGNDATYAFGVCVVNLHSTVPAPIGYAGLLYGSTLNATTWDYIKIPRFKDVDLKADASVTQMRKITTDGGGPFLNVASGEDVYAKFEALPAGMYFVTLATGAVNSPVSSGFHVGVLKKPISKANFWTVEVCAYNINVMYHASNYNGTIFEWKQIATQNILNGTGTPSNTLGKDGDIYIQYV